VAGIMKNRRVNGRALEREGVETVEGADQPTYQCAAFRRVGIRVVKMMKIGSVLGLAMQGEPVDRFAADYGVSGNRGDARKKESTYSDDYMTHEKLPADIEAVPYTNFCGDVV